MGLSWRVRFPDGVPAMQAAGTGTALFSKVRVVLRFPNGGLALDTLVTFPDTATDLQVTLGVVLPANAPDTGQALSLTLDYRNNAGQTVFTGGPVTVKAIPARPGEGPPPPSPVEIPLVYTGTGARAKSVVITPAALQVNMGDSLVFTGEARDSAGVAIPGTPVLYEVADSTLASIKLLTGRGIAANKRGVTTVIARLLTGQADTAALTVVPVPAGIAKVAGDSGTGTVDRVLTGPLVVRITAPDGQPVAGAPVNFTVTSGGGSVAAASGPRGGELVAQRRTARVVDSATAANVTPANASVSGAMTDSVGVVSASWVLGVTAGVQQVTVDAGAGLTTVFTAFATPDVANDISLVSGDAQQAVAGAALAQPFVVKVADSFGNGVAGVAITWTVTAGGGTLGTGTSITDALGRAQNTLTLGALAGVISVTAANANVDPVPVTFTATATSALASAVWTGATSSAWNVASNWLPAAVPTANDSVLIQPGGTQPVLAAGAAVRHLTVLAGATLNIGAQVLTVGGNLAAGTTITGTGTVVLAGKTGTFSGVTTASVVVADTSTYTLSGRAQVSGASGVAINGALVAGGRTLQTTALSVAGASGALNMTNAADSVIVNGNATFASATGSALTAGVLSVSGNFTQSTNPLAFGASGSHVTVLTGAALQTVTFANPGTGAGLSHFGTLRVSNVSSGGIGLASDVFADGQLVMTEAVLHTVTSSNALLTSRGANVNQVSFGNTRWRVTDGAAVTGMSAVTFQAMTPTTSYFTMQRAGDAGSYAFTNWTFAPAPTGAGLYMDLDDITLNANALTVTMTGANPAGTGGKVRLNAGPQTAVLVGWSNIVTWAGSTSAAWNTAANWNPAVVPDSTANVVIPQGTLFAPLISTTGTVINNLTIDPSASMTIDGVPNDSTTFIKGNLTIGANAQLILQDTSFAVVVGGNITTAISRTSGITGCATDAFVLAFGTANQITGRFCNLAIGAGAYTASGPMEVTGTMIVNGGTFTPNGNVVSVAGDFGVVGTGALAMTKPADSVTVTGSVAYNATTPSTLTGGKLVLYGDFIEVGSVASFPATSGHTTIFAGTNPSVYFTHPGAGAGNSHFGTLSVLGDSVTFSTNAYADGQLVVSGPTTHTLVGANNVLTTAGANVDQARFSDLRWTITDGAAVSGNMSNVTFESMTSTSTYFTMQRTGGSYLPFTNWVFSTVPTGAGLYMDLHDTAADGNPLTVTMVAPNPTLTSGFVRLNAGPQLAVLNGWGNLVTWTGNINTDWNTTKNWSPEVVPTATADVRIPAGTPNAPLVATIGTAMHDLTLDPAANLTVDAGRTSVTVMNGALSIGQGAVMAVKTYSTLNALGNVVIDKGGRLSLQGLVGDGVDGVNLYGDITTDTAGATGFTDCDPTSPLLTARGGGSKVTGKFCAFAIDPAAKYSAAGPVDVGGDLYVNGTLAADNSAISVGGSMIVNGSLVTQQAADSVTVRGAANFLGTGGSVLTNGTLVLYGDFSESGQVPNVFAPTSAHTTILAGTKRQTITFAHSDTGVMAPSHFGTLVLANVSDSVDLASNVFADGQFVTVGAGAHILTSPGYLLTSRGANVSTVTFNRLTWKVEGGAPITAMNAVRFDNNCCARQFVLIRSDDGSAYPDFKDWDFAFLDGGTYLDLTGVGPLLTVRMSNPMVAGQPSTGYSANDVVLRNAKITGWP